MIRHVVLFKFKPGIDWDDPRAAAGERTAAKVGSEVPELRDWRYGRNISPGMSPTTFSSRGSWTTWRPSSNI